MDGNMIVMRGLCVSIQRISIYAAMVYVTYPAVVVDLM